jgi:hypothetical protein
MTFDNLTAYFFSCIQIVSYYLTISGTAYFKLTNTSQFKNIIYFSTNAFYLKTGFNKLCTA